MTQHGQSCLKRLLVSDRTDLFKLSSNYYNPSTWSLWRALILESKDSASLPNMSSIDWVKRLHRLAHLSCNIASGLAPLLDDFSPGIHSILSGFSPDFRLLVNYNEPAESKIVELFTGRVNPRGFKFLPWGWPYPIRYHHLEHGEFRGFIIYYQLIDIYFSVRTSCLWFLEWFGGSRISNCREGFGFA